MRLRQLLSAFLVALLLPIAAWAQADTKPVAPAARDKPVHIAYLFSDGNIPGTLKALQALLDQQPALKGRIKLTLLTESTYADVKPDDIKSSDVLVFDTMNEQMLQKFNAENKTDLIKDVQKHGAVLGVGEGLFGQDAYIKQGVVWDKRARAYWENSGAQNQEALMAFALSKAGVKGLKLPEPQISRDFSYYYPDGKGGRVFDSWKAFDDWRAANGKKHPGAPRIAISFFKASYYTGDIGMIDALIAEVEKQGGEAIPMFGYPGAVAAEKLLIDDRGAPRADVLLGLNFAFSDFNASKSLEKLGVPVINLVSLYGRSEKEWRESKTGLSMFEGTFNLAVPELAGTTAPTVVGTKEKVRDPATGLTSVITAPIASRVPVAVARAMKYAALRAKPNSQKKIALIYYNYPPGKASIGASYLNVAESIANILKRMGEEGYDIGGPPPSADQVLKDITTKARNVISHAPGELDEMVATGSPIRVPLAEYRKWLDGYAPALRAKIIKDWGDPAKASLMVSHGSMIIPAVQYGKVLLTPQPSRAWGEDLEKMYHAEDLAPHHQYVAAYAWLRNGFKADAVVHIGTHGTLEWLDGKDAGLSEEDAPDALIADLPDAYIYNVDVVAEGLVARRRGMATLVDHMVPPFRESGLNEGLAKLSELMSNQDKNESKNPELSAIYARQVREQATKLGIAKDLGLPPDKDWSEEDLHHVEDYILELKGKTIPFGLHAFGRTPTKEMIDSTVAAITKIDRKQTPEQRVAFSADMAKRIEASGPRELDSLMKALSGHFVPAGGGGEPIRNPDAYATGNNIFGIDPDKVPTPAAWEMGTKLAQQMLDQDFRKNGKYPEKISFVIWGDETMRHEGVLESQIFYLLGTKPVWNDRGKVVGVEVIPREKLGRPRVDIVIASAAEGMFTNVTRLMDEAVQRTKAMDEADNMVRKHYLATKAALMAKGVKAEDADRMAGVRIFDEPPGEFNLNTSTIVANSGSWDSDAGFANDYIRKMGHGYGNGYWGEAMADVFRLNLQGVDQVVHSNSTTLYGALDNDDMFMYVGGLASAVRSIDGKSPDIMVTNTRDLSHPEMTSINKFVGEEFKSRYINPTWIKGMQKEGYAGARAMSEFVEYLWGWDATVTDVVDDQMWQATFDTYIADKQNLGMKQFFEDKSPFALQDIAARMLETTRKGYWKADAATKARLLKEYIDSINAHGVNCSELTCSNGRLLDYVMKEAKAANIPAADIEKAQAALEKAMNKKIDVAARELENFARTNEAREAAEQAAARKMVAEAKAAARNAANAVPSPAKAPTPSQAQPNPQQPPADTKVAQASAAKKALEGFLMQQEDHSRKQQAAKASDQKPQPLTTVDFVWPGILLVGLMLGWRWRSRSVHA
jgi:cobaltochelatase CobN